MRIFEYLLGALVLAVVFGALAFGIRGACSTCVSATSTARSSSSHATRLDRIGPLTASGVVISTELLVGVRRARNPIVEIGVHHYPRHADSPIGASPRHAERASVLRNFELYELGELGPCGFPSRRDVRGREHAR